MLGNFLAVTVPFFSCLYVCMFLKIMAILSNKTASSLLFFFAKLLHAKPQARERQSHEPRETSQSLFVIIESWFAIALNDIRTRRILREKADCKQSMSNWIFVHFKDAFKNKILGGMLLSVHKDLQLQLQLLYYYALFTSIRTIILFTENVYNPW